MKTWTGSSSNFRNLLRPHLTHLTYLTILALPLAGCLQESSFSPNEAVAAATESTGPPQAPVATEALAELSPDTDTEEALAAADEQSLSTAPTKKVSTEIQVPANLKPTPATAEIIKLANAGVEEGVMFSFVTNSLGTFNLRAEEIIYLNDIGVPSAVVTAMIQRDHLLQGASADVAVTPPEPAVANPPVSEPDAMPEQGFSAPDFSAEPAPMPAYASDSYTVPAEPEPSVTDYTDYYDALAPYGNWVDIEGSGRCWQPTVVIGNHGWGPYFDCGRWVYTDCGWYWMSDYSWGWAPFHYGRWFQHATLGWCWRPDRVWGPSWVCWRHDRDYCGWAPLPPGARFVAGVGLTFHGHRVGHVFSFGLAANHFPFVPFSHFLDHNPSRHVLSHDRATRIFDHTTASTGIIAHNHTVLNNGVPRDDVAAATHVAIRPAVLHNVSPSEGVALRERFEHNGRTLAVYRPDAPRRDNLRPPSVVNRPIQPPSLNRAVTSSSQTSGRSDFAHVQAPVTQTPGTALRSPVRADEPRLRTGQPLIVHGSDRARQPAITSTVRNPRGTVPLNSLVVIGQHHDSRIAGTQPEDRPLWNSHSRTALSSSHDWRNSRTALRDDDYSTRDGFRQPQTPAQSTWWAGSPRADSTQPQQPRTSNHEQFRSNHEVPMRGGDWNPHVESPRQNYSMPAHSPEHVHTAPVESHQSHSAPVESHVSHSEPQVDHSSHSAPAPAPSSSSSSSSHSSSSSGRSR